MLAMPMLTMMFVQTMLPALHQTPLRTVAFLLCLLMILFFISGCGQVITLSPTPAPTPTPAIVLTLAVDSLPPTATPAPYTPEPTFTPTLTPTPVFHTVQSGQSLLSIATQYELSVAALQEANGILDPRTLQAGQQLIIPRPEEAAEAAEPTPTPTPLALQIQNIYLGNTQIGNLWILGEVQNDTDTPLEQVRIGAHLLNLAGETVASRAELVAIDLVVVGDRAPFALLFEAPHPQFDRYQIFIEHAVPAYVGSYYRDLAINQLETVPDRSASYTVNGTILNTGPEEAVGVQVVLTGYDSLDRVVATRKIDPEYNVIPRGGETNFSAILTPLGGPIERIEAIAQGRRLQTQP
jgi:LysM repeat protein